MATARQRKNIFIDQAKLDRAVRLLGARTETEAVDRALDLVDDHAVFAAEVDRGMTELIGRGGFVDRFKPRRRGRKR